MVSVKMMTQTKKLIPVISKQNQEYFEETIPMSFLGPADVHKWGGMSCWQSFTKWKREVKKSSGHIR